LQEKFKQTLLLIILTYLIIMRKKFIAVYALMAVLALGSTTLTSCVDDNESASVTAIRDAKAKQLAAIAAQEEAMARLKDAKAAYEQAMADAKNEETAMNREKFDELMKQTKAEVEKAIAEAKRAQEKAEQEMQGNLMEHQKGLYCNYKKAQKEVIDVTGQIVDKKLEIVKLEAGIEETKAIAANKIYDENVNIAKYTAEKAAYEALGENNYDELIKQQAQLKVEEENKENIVSEKNNDKTAAENAYNKAKVQKVDGGEIKVNDQGDKVKVESPLETVNAIKELEEMKEDGKFSLDVVDKTNGEKIKASEESEYSTYSYTLAILNQVNVKLATKQLENAIKAAEDAKESEEIATPTSGVATIDQYNNILFAKDTNPQEILNYFADAKKAADEALKALAEKDPGYKAAKAAADQAKENLELANIELPGKVEKAITDAKEVKADFDAAIALIDTNSDAYKAYKKAVEDLINNEGKAYVTANEAWKAAQLDYAETTGKLAAVDNLVGNKENNIEGTVIDIQKEMLECDEDIAEAQAKIKKYEQLIDVEKDAENSGNMQAIEDAQKQSQQALLEEAKGELEDLNERLTIAQAAEKSWKEQLEASLKGEEAPAEETPAE
jgi:RNase P/RNase MRP subunit p29